MKRLPKFVVDIRRLLSALTSSHPAARWAIARQAVTPVSSLIDQAISLSTPQYDPLAVEPRWVLLCSPPRSGSTVLYQSVTRVLDCAYVTNLHQMLPRTAHRLLRNIPRLFSSPKGLKSYYGHTKELLNVNEGNWLVDYWFQTNGVESVRRRFLNTMQWLTGGGNKVVIIKNVGIYYRIADLYEAVPELLIVRIQRETKQVIESELKGFHELGYFNPIPAELKNVPIDDPVKFAVTQISTVERILDEQLKHIPSSRLFNWSYERFCESPEDVMEPLARKIRITPDWSNLPEELRISESQKVSPEESNQIEKLLAI